MKLSEEVRNHEFDAPWNHDGYYVPDDVDKKQDEWADHIEQLEQRLATARKNIRNYVKQLDDMYGTPCEQIRHKQEVERLEQQLAECDEAAEKATDAMFEAEYKTERLEQQLVDLREDRAFRERLHQKAQKENQRLRDELERLNRGQR